MTQVNHQDTGEHDEREYPGLFGKRSPETEQNEKAGDVGQLPRRGDNPSRRMVGTEADEGIETAENIKERMEFLRQIGYKLG